MHLCMVKARKGIWSFPGFDPVRSPGTAGVDRVVRCLHHRVSLWLRASHLAFVHVSPSVKQVNALLLLAAAAALLKLV